MPQTCKQIGGNINNCTRNTLIYSNIILKSSVRLVHPILINLINSLINIKILDTIAKFLYSKLSSITLNVAR